MGRTQEQRRAETRARLLAAAADLFARKGFHATSAEAVAGAAERTTGALYDHFGGKEGLLVGLLEQWIEQTIVDLTGVLEVEPDLDARLGALWEGVIRRDSETGDAWLLLEFELWLHAVRDPQLGVVGAERFHVMREALGVGLGEWADEFGFALPADGDELAVQIIGLLVGAAFQYRLDPAAVPKRTVVAGLRRLLDLPADAPMVASASGTGTDHRNEGAAP
jgi:AcrR family transcriptional regulator